MHSSFSRISSRQILTRNKAVSYVKEDTIVPEGYYLIAAEPIIIGLLPYSVYNFLHKWKMRKNQKNK